MAEKELSMVISAFNEEKNVENLFKKLINALNKLGINWEIVFINNHSTDMTGELAEHISRRDKRIHLIQRYNRENKDLGSSLREGFKNCTGKYIIIMDADLSHDPEEIKDIFIHRHDADIIIGSRFTKGGKSDMPVTRVIISKTYNFLVNLILDAKVNDITTGFKLYKRNVIDSLKLVNNGFGIHVEILLKAVHKGYTTKEIPIYYRTRTEGKSKLSYARQFKRYAEPVLEMIKIKLGLSED
ncbi:MAG: glycosyltransferase [Candidatus Aenigmarchaeota archaeon]|nr:glycosyltransferase [Candidatus Aenigmarchaeota archaeon]